MTDPDFQSMPEDRASELVYGFLDGTLDDGFLDQLCCALAEDSSVVSALVESAVLDEMLVRHFEHDGEVAVQKALHSILHLDGVNVPAMMQADGSPASPRIRRMNSRWMKGTWVKTVSAASVLLVLAGAYLFVPREVAMVTRLVDAQVADDTLAHVGARLKEGDRLEVKQGLVELTFDRGTVVAIKGPADFQIVSDMRAASRSGRITFDVGERATGFRVETPSASIVDWGTKFGVGVEGEETDVVVFDGIVDLHARSGSEQPTRLTQGDALRVSGSGELHRIMSVSDSEFPTPHGGNIASRSAVVIESVSDNVRDGATNKCYRVVHGGLRDDATAYVDRSHEWNGLSGDGLPRFLVGADYVMPFNEDKRVQGLRVAVTFARDANVYVFYDARVPAPDWLTSRFEDTGVDVGLDEGPSTTLPDWTTGAGGGVSVDTHFRVWKSVVSAGERVVLGPRAVDDQRTTVSKAMYAVAAVALDN